MDDKSRDRVSKIEMKRKLKEASQKASSSVVGWCRFCFVFMLPFLKIFEDLNYLT